MDLLAAFIIFIGVMVASLIYNLSMLPALAVGFVCFYTVARRRGYSAKEVIKFAWGSGRESLVVVQVLLFIGVLTSMWRSSGTITFFVYYGIEIIRPSLFIIITFLLSCLLSYALGTSFGVAGTVGVIFMVLARSGGVNELLTAGAIISGVFFGDRGSPVSSSALLVASVTKTNIYNNVKMMMKTVVLPMSITTSLYTVLSVQNPIQTVDPTISRALDTDFNMSPWLMLPAILILILPLFRVPVLLCMITSIMSAFGLTVFLQGESLLDSLSYAIFGFSARSEALYTVLNGGGLISMLEVCGIVFLSCCFSGIFSKTSMLNVIMEPLEKLSNKIGRFGTMIVVSVITNAVFCNQTLSSVMFNDLLCNHYEKSGVSKMELVIDIENSVIIIAPLIPWCIACTVPAAMLGHGPEVVPYSILLFIIPISYMLTKGFWFKKKV